MAYEEPTFSLSDYDQDGDVVENGVFLNFDNTRIRVADDKEEFTRFIKHLQKIEKEIYDNY